MYLSSSSCNNRLSGTLTGERMWCHTLNLCNGWQSLLLIGRLTFHHETPPLPGETRGLDTSGFPSLLLLSLIHFHGNLRFSMCGKCCFCVETFLVVAGASLLLVSLPHTSASGTKSQRQINWLHSYATGTRTHSLSPPPSSSPLSLLICQMATSRIHAAINILQKTIIYIWKCTLYKSYKTFHSCFSTHHYTADYQRTCWEVQMLSCNVILSNHVPTCDAWHMINCTYQYTNSSVYLNYYSLAFTTGWAVPKNIIRMNNNSSSQWLSYPCIIFFYHHH